MGINIRTHLLGKINQDCPTAFVLITGSTEALKCKLQVLWMTPLSLPSQLPGGMQ